MDLIDVGLFGSYVLILVCAIAAIGIPLVQAAGDPKSLVKSAVGVGTLLVVFLIGYLLADGNAKGATESTSKLVGAGIISMYVLFFGAIIGIVITEVTKMIK
jgi:hypothetical protein